MAIRKAQATWEGSLREGQGAMNFGTYAGPYTWSSRFEEGQGANPEELLGAAHAGCYSMALCSGLGNAGFTPRRISTSATVYLERVEGKARITKIHLETRAEVPGISNEAFLKIAEDTKLGCPVSVALSSVTITLDAQLV